MDYADPLGIMTLTRGPTGARTYPLVGTLPSVIIGLSAIVGVGFIFTGGKFILSPSIRQENWWLVKLLGATAVGGIAAHLFIALYEQNHAFQHGSQVKQREAINS